MTFLKWSSHCSSWATRRKKTCQVTQLKEQNGHSWGKPLWSLHSKSKASFEIKKVLSINLYYHYFHSLCAAERKPRRLLFSLLGTDWDIPCDWKIRQHTDVNQTNCLVQLHTVLWLMAIYCLISLLQQLSWSARSNQSVVMMMVKYWDAVSVCLKFLVIGEQKMIQMHHITMATLNPKDLVCICVAW